MTTERNASRRRESDSSDAAPVAGGGSAGKQSAAHRRYAGSAPAEPGQAPAEGGHAQQSGPGGAGTATGAGNADPVLVPRGGKEYTIKRGDTLSKIAKSTYGQERYWRNIMETNPFEVHKRGNLIYVGHVLFLPKLEVPLETAPGVDLERLGKTNESSPDNPAVGVGVANGALILPEVCLPRDYAAVFDDILLLSEEDRRTVLLQIRERGEWEAFLDALGPQDISVVQSWLPAQEGQEGNYTLEERIKQAHNSTRGQAALAAVDAAAAVDPNVPPRITPRIRELLSLGVALPALEGNELASEGVLSVQSATRAAEALVAMPPREYLRVTMQLTLVGAASALNQSFNLLKAVAARRDQFLDTNPGNDSLQAMEKFADGIRGLDDKELVRQTNVTQIDPAELGMQQRFTMSCNVTSALVARGQADPVEAFRLHQKGEMDVTNLGGEVAKQTEKTLENHGGNVAVARDSSAVTGDVNQAILELAGKAPADELAAVSDYMAGRAFDAAKYAAGIVKVRKQIGADGEPNDQAMRLTREAAIGGSQPGLTPNQLKTEWNDSLDVDKVTGQTASVDWDSQLWALYTADANHDGKADRVIPNPVPATWTTRISSMLGRAKPRLEAGEDLSFNVYWHNGGGHTMTFTNVRKVEGVTSFLVHDTWTGKTAWVKKSDILQAKWPGITANRGILCALIG